jgi:hypothetical protein
MAKNNSNASNNSNNASTVTLLKLPLNKHANGIANFIKKLDKKKLCYLSLNTGYGALINFLNKKNIKTKNILFIDCVTKTIATPPKDQNCIYLTSPNALTQISLAIKRALKSEINVILIDSLSTLLVYHNQNTLTKFVHDLVHKVKETEGISLVFTISQKDENTTLFKNTSMVADKVKKG